MALLKTSSVDNKQQQTGVSTGDFDVTGIISAGAKGLPEPDTRWRKAMISLAEAQMRHNRPADAIPNLIMLCRTDENDHYAARLLALAFARSDKWPEAQAILDRISGYKKPVNPRVSKTWNKVRRLVYICWRVAAALYKYGFERLKTMGRRQPR